MFWPLLAGFGILSSAATLLGVGPSQADADWSDVLAVLDRESRKAALERLEETGDRSLLAGLNDLLYYHYVARDRFVANRIASVMEAIADESVQGNGRRGWAEWIGRHDEIEPREGYLFFKRTVFQRYDPAFRGFLNPRFTFRIRPEEIEWGGVKKDGIPALDRPGFVPAVEAEYLRDDDRVFGVYLNGVAKAYPHRILDAHEMCNDVVGGAPVSLSYCTLCGSGILYRGDPPSRTGKEPFTFGSSGLLYRSNKLMYDRPTNSLWNNLTGEPVSGRLAESGIRLERLPLVVSTWRAWKTRHPGTLVLDVENTGFDRDYRKSPYENYFRSRDTMFPVWLTSDALEKKDWVYALIVNGRPKAYPIETLREERLTHDELGGKSIVLVTDPDGAVRAYESGKHRFVLGEQATLRDDSTGRTWRVEEDYLDGPDGSKLPRIAGHRAFWFGWYAFYPTTEIYRHE